MQVFPGLSRVDLGEVEYEAAVAAMHGWVAQCQAGTAGDRLFLLSHPPVVTYGSRTSPADLPAAASGLPVVEVDRGGQATYHGPGQIVGYLVANVRERGPADVVRWMEQGIIAALAELGVPAVRRQTPPGGSSLVGVWTPRAGLSQARSHAAAEPRQTDTVHRKIASIGMRIRGGVSSHGFALNVDPDMTAFDQFVSCGLADPITSLQVLAEERGEKAPHEDEVRDALAKALGAS
ncbi:lipoyl(octanoyl) transferase [Pseudonocardia hierapolitana]|uniref:Octanoyltransferase n=1 Tax=Pseudonocardia hierapolitana TaxID=1128676 RepID=A0A561SW03_9PSEU|nr:lipoyl(octanoyl) transferase LipB [Pseudonocardia hierapolitana]TWF79039.1 lipoyl(octanoyl) transferase [Pseudonocardia hierapolitana]